MADYDDHDNAPDEETAAGLPRFVEPDYNLDMTRTTVKEAEPDSCCTRCSSEWRYAWFSVQEGEKTLDIAASFGPNSTPARLIKFAMFLLFNGSLAAKLYEKRALGAFWLAFLTNWSMLFASAWVTVSLINSLIPLSQPKRPTDSVGLWIKFCWLLFPVAACFTLMVSILYWSLDFQPGDVINYMQVYTHAGVLLVWPEGLILNRIPVRWKHVFVPMFLAACYVAWMAIHQMLTDLGNPNNHLYPEIKVTDDDLLYEAVDFEEKPTSSSILVVMVVFVVTPLIYLLLWTLSLCSFPCSCSGYNRRYLSGADRTAEGVGGKAPTDNVNIYETD